MSRIGEQLVCSLEFIALIEMGWERESHTGFSPFHHPCKQYGTWHGKHISRAENICDI